MIVNEESLSAAKKKAAEVLRRIEAKWMR
jgi:hypothetical protein